MALHKIKVDTTIKVAKPMSAMHRLSDGDGLHLLVKPDDAVPNGRAFNRTAHRAEVVPLHSQLA